MENIYKAYSKEIGGKVYYFVKKYSTFPECKDLPPILDMMGMHEDFYKACDIAKIYDEEVIARFLNELHILPESAPVIHMQKVRSMTSTLIKNTQHALLKLGIVGIN
jgi:hypothetical protein